MVATGRRAQLRLTYIELLAMVLSTCFLYIASQATEDTRGYSEEEFLKLYKSVNGDSKKMATVCLTSEECLEIRDDLVTQGNRSMMIRSATMAPYSLAVIALRLPKALTSSSLDTQSWEVNWELDFDGEVNDAIHAMIREMYESGMIREKSFSSAQVLSIGLGAGVLNGYLHNKYPKMNITVVEVNDKVIQMARDWFGLKVDKNQHVVLMDGADYVRHAALEGRQYDIIFLDACSMQEEDNSLCPIKSFQQDAVIKHLAKMAGKKGIVFVNVLSRSSTKKLTKVVSAKYDQHFKYRKQTSVKGIHNHILSYSQYKYEGLAEVQH